jgi:HPr kinase/phosphorylase
MDAPLLVHGGAVARGESGVLILGAPASGKSDLVLRLIHHGFTLVADDQVLVADGQASPPPTLAGLLEVRGLGIFRLPWRRAALRLAVLLEPGERLPQPECWQPLDLPVIRLEAGHASAALRVALALDCLEGTLPMVAGAFA